MEVVYSAEVTSGGDGRNGFVQSSDGILAMDLSAPKEVGGPGGATNPEQLFAAGYAACFHSALRLAARGQKVELRDDEVLARVHLRRDRSGYSIGAELTVRLPNVDRETARSLANAAHERCPYSRAISGNVDVEVTVES